MNRPGSSSASRVTVAFTPDMHSTTTPERAAARTTPPGARGPRTAVVSGSTAHGASIPGSAADEVDPITMVNVGHRANTRPASRREAGDPMSSASASLTSPAKPTAMISESHSRSVSQTGTCASWPAR